MTTPSPDPDSSAETGQDAPPTAGTRAVLDAFAEGDPDDHLRLGDLLSGLRQTAFGMTMVDSRTVLVIYFDKNKKVVDKAVYGLKDGKTVTIETRRTPSFGEDRTFIDSILSSF